MNKKNLLVFLESHVDKIVLGVIVLVSLVLLWRYVIGNPYSRKVRISGREVSVGPGEIDRKVSDEAEKLKAAMEKPSQLMDKYGNNSKPIVADFIAKMQCSISDVPADMAIPSPGAGTSIVDDDRLYPVPAIPPLTAVAAAALRGAVQAPTEEVTSGMPYSGISTQLKDMDFVTVSGRFDIRQLYNNFQLSFAGPGLKTAWKNLRLAKPVLARIELQRRVKQPDGTFSDWTVVPRTQIDMYKKVFEQLPLSADQMQMDISILMTQYGQTDVQLDILQPTSYIFGVSRVEWMPPDYLNETLKILDKEKEQTKKQLREEQKKMLEQQQSQQRGGQDRRGTPRQIQPRLTPQARRGGRESDLQQPQLERTPPPGSAAAARKTERTRQDIQKDVQKDTLKDTVKLDSLRDPVLVWVHDDTVQPGNTYEYRVRLGVFNPIMGKNWFRQDQQDFKNQVVLWSDFSAPTGTIDIPKMLYVFPLDTLAKKDASKEVEGVKAEVAKYYMGKWRTHSFDIYPGEVIGYPVAFTEEEKKRAIETLAAVMPKTGDSEETKVDYTSDQTLVDVVEQNRWDTRTSRRTDFYTMLYSDVDGLSHVGIGKANWPKEYTDAYKAVQEAMDEGVEQRNRMMEDMMTPEMPGVPGMPLTPGMPFMPGMS